MTVVDTSVWAAFFNGESTLHAAELDHLLATGGSVGIIPIILTEVLQGFRTDSGFEEAKKLLTQLPLFHPSIATYIEAARLYRALRHRGVTVRGTIDCLIAQSCIETSALLLTADRDFRLIAEHTKLQLYQTAIPD